MYISQISSIVYCEQPSCYDPFTIELTLKRVPYSQAELIAELYGLCKPVVLVADDSSHHLDTSSSSDLKVVKVIYNKPATIVFWNDGTKTVVVCDKKDKYDPEKGFYIACAKKLFGNDFKAGGKINKALELAVGVSKHDK